MIGNRSLRSRNCPSFLLMSAFFLLTLYPLTGAVAETAIAAESSEGMLQSSLSQARALEAAGQYEQAIAAYRAHLGERPDDDEARAALARLLSRQGQYDEAVTLYQEILTRHPVDLDVRLALARVRSWQKRWEDARVLYLAVLNEAPDSEEAERGLADVSYWSGDYGDALARYQRLFAATKDPELEKRIEAVRAELAKPAVFQSPRAVVSRPELFPSLPYRDYLKVGYSHYTYSNQIADERDWLAEIGKSLGAQTLIARIEALNRFGVHDTPLSGELYSSLWSQAWGYVGGSFAANPRFSPNWSGSTELFQGLGVLHPGLSSLEASIGYRHLRFPATDVDLLIPGLTIYLPYNLWLTEKVYFVPNTGAITLSSQLTWRPADRLQLFVGGSFGTSGERIISEQDAVTRISTRLVQGGITFPLARWLSAEAALYYEDRETLFIRRGGTFNLIYHW
jgi:YaiO family outer membrane protein